MRDLESAYARAASSVERDELRTSHSRSQHAILLLITSSLSSAQEISTFFVFCRISCIRSTSSCLLPRVLVLQKTFQRSRGTSKYERYSELTEQRHLSATSLKKIFLSSLSTLFLRRLQKLPMINKVNSEGTSRTMLATSSSSSIIFPTEPDSWTAISRISMMTLLKYGSFKCSCEPIKR